MTKVAAATRMSNDEGAVAEVARLRASNGLSATLARFRNHPSFVIRASFAILVSSFVLFYIASAVLEFAKDAVAGGEGAGRGHSSSQWGSGRGAQTC